MVVNNMNGCSQCSHSFMRYCQESEQPQVRLYFPSVVLIHVNKKLVTKEVFVKSFLSEKCIPPLARTSMDEVSMAFQPGCTCFKEQPISTLHSANFSTKIWSKLGSSNVAIIAIADPSFLLDGLFIRIDFRFLQVRVFLERTKSEFIGLK